MEELAERIEENKRALKAMHYLAKTYPKKYKIHPIRMAVTRDLSGINFLGQKREVGGFELVTTNPCRLNEIIEIVYLTDPEELIETAKKESNHV